MAFNFSKIISSFKEDLKDNNSVVVGVDIGSSAIKVVQIHDNKGVVTLDTYGELQLGPYGNAEIGRTVNLQTAKLTEALVDIMRESGVSGKRVSLAISYHASFITMLTLPTKDTEEIAARIPVEARKYVPVSLSEVTLDWFPLPNGAQANETSILLAAIYNDALSKYRSVTTGASLNAQITEIELFSTIRSTLEQTDTNAAIIDCGARGTKIYITGGGMIRRAHVVRVGGVELTNAIASATSIPFEAAEEQKRSVGLAGGEGDPTGTALRGELERAFREVHTVLARYKEASGETVDKIILSGSGAAMKGLDVYVQDALQCPTVIADPFSKVAYPAFLEDTLREAGPSFAVAIGAALRGISQQ